jgi:hypothetical protein
LAEITAEIKVNLDIEVAGILIPTVVKPLTKLPTCPPCFFVGVRDAAFAMGTVTVDRTQL